MKFSTAIVILQVLIATAVALRARKHSHGQSGGSYSSSSSNSASSSSSSTSSSNSNSIIANLLLAPTAVDRINLLDQNSDFIFNFVDPPTTSTTVSGAGGSIVVANRASFPAVIGSDLSMGIGFIGPCGLNAPHTHPRATELTYIVNGTLTTGFIAENGARQVTNVVSGGAGVIFPKGSIHWLANLGCDPVVFVASFDDVDPGLSSIAQNFFGIEEDVLSATLGGVSSDSLQQTASSLPSGVILGLETCLQKCGLSYTSGNSNGSNQSSGCNSESSEGQSNGNNQGSSNSNGQNC